ncbi:MAG: hypothetical protein LBR64_04880 [Dysgonamonadaceae bacterium]|jgi:hypothetical protein|nr:hypothetical protein [Dysgonamonadaceae bacterium]
MNKKLFLTVIFSVCLIAGAFAQDAFQKGDKVINLGVGLHSWLTINHADASFPPIGASLDYSLISGLLDDHAAIGVGGYVGFASSKWHYSEDLGYNLIDMVFGARGTFHYQFVDRLDTYGGVLIGYDVVSKNNFGNGAIVDNTNSKSSAVYGTFIGGRFYFTENIAVYAELGYGIAALELGLSYKF